MTALYFLCAVLMLTIGHAFKGIRWKRFVSIYESTPLSTLLSGLAAGYLVNFYLPLHFGDLLRVGMAGRKMRNGYGYAMATLIVDRCLDLVCVALLFLIIGGITRSAAYLNALWIYAILTAVILTGLILIGRCSRLFKKAALSVASLFNESIKYRVLMFFWSLIVSFKDLIRKIDLKRLLLDTAAMWLSYLASYWFITAMLRQQAVAVSFTDIFYMMFHTGALLNSTFAITSGTFGLIPELLLCGYILIPLPTLLGISLLLRKKTKAAEPMRLLPQLEPVEQMQFLHAYFEGKNRDSLQEFLSMNQDVSIIRDCSAGSDATTMLCISPQGTVYRKYAFGTAPAQKLSEQVQWLQEEKDDLPLPEICKVREGRYSFSYDMLCQHSTVGLFEYIYSKPVAQSWAMLRSILELLYSKLYSKASERVTAEDIRNYISDKVTNNLQLICQNRQLHGLTQRKTLVINGISCRGLPVLQTMLEPEHLSQIFSGDRYSVVHGDLTVENIVCNLADDSYYLIDPNPGNPIKTPGIDYAKLLQSLHGGYEFLGISRSPGVEENEIHFLLPASDRYHELYRCFHRWMTEHMSPEEVRSVYYHEIVHWLRLLPYKLRKNEKNAVPYFAALITVMNDIYERYEEPAK